LNSEIFLFEIVYNFFRFSRSFYIFIRSILSILLIAAAVEMGNGYSIFLWTLDFKRISRLLFHLDSVVLRIIKTAKSCANYLNIALITLIYFCFSRTFIAILNSLFIRIILSEIKLFRILLSSYNILNRYLRYLTRFSNPISNKILKKNYILVSELTYAKAKIILAPLLLDNFSIWYSSRKMRFQIILFKNSFAICVLYDPNIIKTI
jgi:hypothetical protein